MNRSDLIRAVAEKQNMTIAEVEKIFNSAIEMIEVSLACGEPVMFRNFGKLEPRVRAAVTRRNLNTGEEIKVPERTTVLFHPSPKLKERIHKHGKGKPTT